MRNLFKFVDKSILKQALKDKNMIASFDEMVWILNFEWNEFDKVNGINGRAGCQDSPVEFFIMRLAQYLAYDIDTIDYIYKDMKRAKDKGFNPIFDKYARMMKYTDKESFEKLKLDLEELSPVKENLLKEIKDKIEKKNSKVPDGLIKLRPNKSIDKRISSVDYYIEEISFLSLKTLWNIEDIVEDHNRNLVKDIYNNTIYLYKILNYGA